MEIKATPEEIAALVAALQERRNDADMLDYLEKRKQAWDEVQR